MRQPVKVKVCGITNAEDASAAVEAGADALGFIFYEQSPRYVVPAVASRIIAELPPLILPVGVFVNEGMATVRSIMDTCGLAMAQLHGDESASYCRELSRPVMKALRLKDRGSLLALAEYQGRGGVRGFVLDSFSEIAYGGTGQVTDWTLAAEVAKSTPILLAGGLTPDNVAQAVRTVRPYGVDVSSGVESAPG
jgi:phosphoribosylanthranilate isomerase